MIGSSGQVFVYNKTKETFLAFRVSVADSVAGRLIGLLGRKSLEPDSGVWIVPANAIHTVGMLFSFDVVMIDKNFKVVSVKELVKPFRVILPKMRAESVIELPAHTVFRSRTQVGDQLVIDRYEARKNPKPDIGAVDPAEKAQYQDTGKEGIESLVGMSTTSSKDVFDARKGEGGGRV